MKRALCTIVLGLYSTLCALDLPPFYRAPFFSGEPARDMRDLATSLNVRVATGSTRKGLVSTDDRISLLNIYGFSNINLLGSNVEVLPSCTTCPKPLTEKFFNSYNGLIPSFDFTCNDGLLSLSGKFKLEEVDVELTQNLLYGFFATLYLPIRRLKINEIGVCNLTNPSNPNAAAFAEFIQNDLNAVLAEHCIEPLCTETSKTDLADFALFAGWHGYDNESFEYIKDLSGELMLGIICPTGARGELDKVISIPIGYDGHWGVAARMRGDAALFRRYLVIGASAGAIIFLNRECTKRLKTDLAQTGLIFLEKGNVNVERGTLWDLGGYLKLDRPLGGLSLLVGTTFVRQEDTVLHVMDDAFLKTFTENQIENMVPNKISKNQVVNSDARFKHWWQLGLHLLAAYDFKAHSQSCLAPKIELFYDSPMLGDRTWATDMFGGSIGFSACWSC